MLRRILINSAIRLALSYQHPRTFTYNSRINYCYFVFHAHRRDNTGRYIVERKMPRHVEVRIPADEEESWPACLHEQHYLGMPFTISRFYKSTHLKITTAIEFLALSAVGYAKLLAWLEIYRQWQFNRAAPNISRTKDILERLADLRKREMAGDPFLAMFDSHKSAFDLMRYLYGDRIYAHPRYDDLYANLRFTLEGYAENGEVSEKDGDYMAKGKAALTLAHLEEQELRHRDQMTVSRGVALLTAALVCVGLLQVPALQRLFGIG